MVAAGRKEMSVADDNSTNRNTLKNQLQQWKLAPTLADSGDEALAILATQSDFDLVLSDGQHDDYISKPINLKW
jgi:two-component system sensor histidine kinase/response regulator